MSTPGNTVVLTCIALVAFAANSLLCRLALESGEIDAASFTTFRLLSGAIALTLILAFRDRQLRFSRPKPKPIAALFAYMIFFSFAYQTLGAATGALLLFGAVQLTMLAVAMAGGERFSLGSWIGFFSAISGVLYLIAPGVSAPDLTGAALMIAAGIGWGAYSLFGRKATDPLAETAANFLYALPLATVVNLAAHADTTLSGEGVLLAVASGALASGLGYAVWYAALPKLPASRAATVQLSVPILTAIGGVLFLAEPISTRLLLASLLTLGGVGVVVAQQSTIHRR